MISGPLHFHPSAHFEVLLFLFHEEIKGDCGNSSWKILWQAESWFALSSRRTSAGRRLNATNHTHTSSCLWLSQTTVSVSLPPSLSLSLSLSHTHQTHVHTCVRAYTHTHTHSLDQNAVSFSLTHTFTRTHVHKLTHMHAYAHVLQNQGHEINTIFVPIFK